MTKIFAIEFFLKFFLTVYVYSVTEIDQILTVYRNQSVESESVESESVDNFGISTVFELEPF
jgi:hypothetical protein